MLLPWIIIVVRESSLRFLTISLTPTGVRRYSNLAHSILRQLLISLLENVAFEWDNSPSLAADQIGSIGQGCGVGEPWVSGFESLPVTVQVGSGFYRLRCYLGVREENRVGRETANSRPEQLENTSS